MLRSGLAAGCWAVLLWVPAIARAQPPTSAVTLTATPSSTISGQRVTLSGQTSNAPPGSDGAALREPVAVGTTATATTHLDVAARSVIRTKPLPLGRAKVLIVLFHPRDLRWGHARVKWSFASGRRGRFVSAPAGRTVKLSPDAIVLYTSVSLPAGHYRWRACFHAPGDRAMADPERPSGCTGVRRARSRSW